MAIPHAWIYVRHTVVVLRKGVSVDDIETTDTEKFFAIDEVLPFTLKNLHTPPFIPALCFHVVKYIGVRLNDHMLTRCCRQFLEKGVNLRLNHG